MLNPKNLESLTQQLHNALPQGLKNVGNDLEEKFKQILQAQLAKLDVVTREEFEVQSQVLLRTREKLNELEKRLDELSSTPSTESQN
ncbi:ubiquinone biosynthesis accessory factor UbiK [Glaesserella parasuis]|uniref:ubiquinone biosynthesis accessory factor UbiK n=1 Tax=Glaesserella parasuis TaxID=738 RepID=UPI0008FCD077|nr:accessory factor UbiK family protein [Glaesserella parasuis]MCT8548143.1 accessory factor UbiK family protein [Glaesserella parasuis]MCT8565671.1 accessory factor UbiK family protein [Glaesserella parasuis]MDE3974517.1 accessory factor UbiK family protein [Glaesserella parasuis]MDG6239091.1 accessory factor UbiK family protein [Glaesserella parasuis]MDG6273498.1 accessory factor UbiK family protein [Glaesserella parasuis]